MAARPCKYGCGVLLEGFDEEARKYKEAQTGGLHTKERCQEAKNKLAQKDDHGNEEVDGIDFKKLTEIRGRNPNLFAALAKAGSDSNASYVDHTAKGQSKVKIFYAPGTEVLEEQYNNFLKINNGQIRTQGAQFQIREGGFAIALYYEEVTKQ